jgi:GTP cyclohydrolase II
MHVNEKKPPRPAKGQTRPAVETVARAIDALRRGQAISVKGDARFQMLAVETASDAALLKLGRRGALLLLTHTRAQTLKIRRYTPCVVALPVEPKATTEELRAIADPTEDLKFPLKGPFNPLRETLPQSYASAVKLTKLAGLLPACIVRRTSARGAVEIGADDIEHYDSEIVRTLKIVARARVPLEGAEKTELVAFRAEDGSPEHYAIVIGAPQTGKPVLARLHSECFTGDLLGSLKCDCGSQLRGAIDAISKAGGGVLLYLAQEGRGIGLINKLRAYRLQDQGFDTMEANERLGFEADERRYAIAAKMLKLLGYNSVRLMTNNPDKVVALKAEGIRVTARVRHTFPHNAHNRAYLQTKARKGGHLF